tara:strand:+ start:357 stop:512 length:156 start_codon:yes stop_codon:yes gene_type:complete
LFWAYIIFRRITIISHIKYNIYILYRCVIIEEPEKEPKEEENREEGLGGIL